VTRVPQWRARQYAETGDAIILARLCRAAPACGPGNVFFCVAWKWGCWLDYKIALYHIVYHAFIGLENNQLRPSNCDASSTCCTVLHCGVVCCGVLQCVAVCCSVLQ